MIPTGGSEPPRPGRPATATPPPPHSRCGLLLPRVPGPQGHFWKPTEASRTQVTVPQAPLLVNGGRQVLFPGPAEPDPPGAGPSDPLPSAPQSRQGEARPASAPSGQGTRGGTSCWSRAEESRGRVTGQTGQEGPRAWGSTCPALGPPWGERCGPASPRPRAVRRDETGAHPPPGHLGSWSWGHPSRGGQGGHLY